MQNFINIFRAIQKLQAIFEKYHTQRMININYELFLVNTS